MARPRRAGAVRVLLVCVRYPPARGGVETHVQRLADGLAERGHGVEVATSALRSEFPFEHLSARERALDDEGPVRVHRFRARTMGGDAHWPWLEGLLPWLARNARRFDVVHAHSYGYHPTLCAALAARLASRPLVLTPHFHPPWSMELGPRRQRLRRAFDALAKGPLLGSADALLCVSRAEASLLQPPRPERVRIVPNGVEPEPFAAARGDALRKRLGLQGPAALFVGRMASNKGLATLLEAWVLVPGATLLLAGDGHLLPVLRARARELGLEERVRFLGALSDEELREAYAACDVAVLPSEYEAFGIVLLEAMAAGKPVVATRVGGVPEVVEEGKTGLLVPPGDARALAQAVAELLNDGKRAGAMGLEGQRRVRERYTWLGIVERVERVYQGLAER